MNFIDFLVLVTVVIMVVTILYFKYFFHRDKKMPGCTSDPSCRSCAKSKKILAEEMRRQYEREKKKEQLKKVREMNRKANIPQADIDMLNEKKEEEK
ncbi:MAG: hypothetical protein WCR63_02135 [Bacilli bacterium]